MPTGFTSWRAVLTDPGLPHALFVTFLVMALSWLVQTPMSILIGTFLAGHQRYREAAGGALLHPAAAQLGGASPSPTRRCSTRTSGWAPASASRSWRRTGWGGRGWPWRVVIFVVSWQFIPFHSLIYQGAVRQIPTSMYEAALIDGAGRVRQFFSITLPQLKYTIITSSTLMVVGSLTFFDLIFVLTAGGPGDATRVLALDMYMRGFQANLMGPASAIAVHPRARRPRCSPWCCDASAAARRDSQLEGA